MTKYGSEVESNDESNYKHNKKFVKKLHSRTKV